MESDDSDPTKTRASVAGDLLLPFVPARAPTTGPPSSSEPDSTHSGPYSLGRHAFPLGGQVKGRAFQSGSPVADGKQNRTDEGAWMLGPGGRSKRFPQLHLGTTLERSTARLLSEQAWQ